MLDADFARCEFFLIRDHDYLSPDSVAKHSEITPGRLFILERHQIENYLLDEEVLSRVLRTIFQQQVSSGQVRADLFRIARVNSAAFLRDMVVTRYAELYQQEDCAIGAHSAGMAVTDANGAVDSAVLAPLRAALEGRVNAINTEIGQRLKPDRLQAIFEECESAVVRALDPTRDDWKYLFPGKYLLQRFAAEKQLGRWPALQNLVIEAMTEIRPGSLGDLPGIFRTIGGVVASS